MISAKKLLILFSVCLNIGFLGVAGYAAFKHRMPGHRPFHRGDLHLRPLEKMTLAPEKRRAVEESIDTYMAEMGEIRVRAWSKKLALLERLGSDFTTLLNIINRIYGITHLIHTHARTHTHK